MENYTEIISEIQALKFSILNNENIQWNNAKLMELYTFVYKKCLEDKSVGKDEASKMYNIHADMLTEFIIDFETLMNDNFTIRSYLDCFEKYEFFCNSLNFIFRYLNKFFILKFKSIPLEERSKNIFLSKFFQKMDKECARIIIEQVSLGYPFSEQFNQDLLDLIQIYRKSEFTNEALLGSLKDGIKEFYAPKNAVFSNVKDFIKYFNYHHDQLSKICFYIHCPNLLQDLVNIFIDSIRTQEMFTAMASEFSVLIEENNIDILKTLFNINSEFFNQCMQIYVGEILFQPNFFHKIYFFYTLADNLTTLCNSDTIKTSFKEFTSLKIKSIPNFCKIFTQEIYKNTKYCFLIQMIENKEEIVVLYGKALLVRLLSNDYIDVTNEINILEEMKKYISNSLMYKLESLIIDYRNAILLSRKYNGKLKTNIYVFSEKTFLNLPISIPLELLPMELYESSKEVISFYKSQFNLRNLVFNFWQSTVSLESTYYEPTRTYCMQMTVIHYLFLYTIQQWGGNATQNKLVEKFELDPYIVSAVLHSLIHPKTPILCKSGQPNMLDPFNDVFTINSKFTSDQSLVRFQLPILNPNMKQERVITDLDVPYFLRSKIMYAAKQKDSLTKDEIYQLVSNISGNVVKIEEQIKYLVEGEYLEDKGEVYEYIA